MALKNKYFTEKLVLFFLILTTIGLLSGCATLPPADDIDNPVVDEPTPTGPGEDPKDPDLKEPTTNNTESETPTNTTTPNPKEPDLKEPTTNNTESETPTNTTTPDPKEPDLKEPTTNNTESETPKPHLRTFYVSNSGDDSNDGLSPQTPWRTISKVNSVNFLPGDAILFKRGDVWYERLSFKSSGNKTNQITYGAYGEGLRPQINSRLIPSSFSNANNWVETSKGSNIWYIVYSSGRANGRWWVDGKEIVRRENYQSLVEGEYFWDRGTGLTNRFYFYSVGNPSGKSFMKTDNRLTVEGKNYITVQHINFVYFHSLHITDSSNWIIEYSNFDYFGSNGIEFYTSSTGKTENIILRYNTLDTYCNQNYNEYLSYNTGDGIRLLQGVKNVEVYGNNFSNWGHTSMEIVAVGSSTRSIENIKVHNNYFYSGDIQYGRAMGFRVIEGLTNPEKPIEFYNNLIVDQAVRSQVGAPYTKIYNNIWFGTYRREKHDAAASAALSIGGSRGKAKSMEIYNNIFAYAAGYGMRIASASTYPPEEDNIIRNNIFFENEERQLWGSSRGVYEDQLFENNIFYSSKTSNVIEVGGKIMKVSDFNALITGDKVNNPHNFITSGNLDVNPLFVDPKNGDFRLKAGSPAIGAGINVGLTHDYAGRPYKNPPSIGPYEYYP
jgi:hypothetical protein